MPASPSPRIVIAGFGLLTPLGQSAWATFRALLDDRTLAQRTCRLPEDVAPVDLVRAVGAVKLAQHGAEDPAVELAERAAREAAFMAGVDLSGLPTFLGSGKGAVSALNAGISDLKFQISDPVPLAVALGPHGYLDHQLRRRLDLKVMSHHVAACASSLTALHFARQALSQTRPSHGIMPAKAGMPSDVLVLTAEASLLPVFIHSYRRLGVLATPTAGAYRQYPLGKRRRGFMLSEMAAGVVLRRLEPGVEPRPGEIELVDTAIASEAYDLIRPNPKMEALRWVADRLLRDPIDVIHPHAPGTADHDPVELQTYREVLNEQRLQSHPPSSPDLYANKGAIGHGLGASGLASLVLACLCLTTGKRPSMPWLEEPMASMADGGWRMADGRSQISDLRSQILDFKSARLCSRTGRHAIFAAGFGGHVAGALIERHK